jgi:arylsulfatase A-like enzyme
MNISGYIDKIKINLFNLKYSIIKNHTQLTFFSINKYREIINLSNRQYIKLNNYFFLKENVKIKKKLDNDLLSIIIVFYSKTSKYFKYTVSGINYNRLVSNNSFNFFKINTKNKKKIKIDNKNKGDVLKIFYVKKRTKKKLVLIILFDGLSKNLTKRLTNSNKFFGSNNTLNNFWSNAPWTLPTFGNLSTGLRTSNHLCFKPQTYYSSFKKNKSLEEINSKITMFEYFKSAGFVTGCYSPYARINQTYRFDRGVDIFKHCYNQDTSQIADDLIAQMEMFNNDSNFMFAHLFDIHHNQKGYNNLQDYINFDDKDYDYQKYIEKDKSRHHKFHSLKNFYEEKLLYSDLKSCDLKLNHLYNYLSKRKFDDFTIILMGDHGTKFQNVNKTSNSLYKYHQNIGFMIKDKKFLNFKKKRNKLIETIDVFPSLLNRYGKLNKNKFKLDGSNTLFSDYEKKYVLSENIYEDNYNSLIFDKKNYLYSSYKLDDKIITKKLSHEIYDLNENQLDINKVANKSKLLDIEKKHMKINKLKKNYE